MKLDHYSFSSLNLYHDCPKKFELTKLHGLVPESTEAMKEGKLLHEIIAIGLKFQDVKGYSEDETQHILNASSYIGDSEIIGIEKRLEVDNGKIVGILDCIAKYPTGMIRIIDWKTGYKRSFDVEQLAMYAYLMYKSGCKAKYYEVSFFNTRWDKLIDVQAFTIEEIKVWGEKLYKTIEEIETKKVFETKVGGHCHYCHLQCSHCPAWNKPFIAVNEHPLQEQYILIEQFLKKLKSIIKDKIDDTGQPIFTESGKVFDIRASESTKIVDMNSMIEKAIDMKDIDLNDIISIKSNKKVDELLERDVIKEFVIKKMGNPRFGLYNK